MITVSKGVLKAHMLSYFRRVEETGETLVVTSHRKPVLRVQPIRERIPLTEAFTSASKGLSVLREDLLAPESADWEALR